MRSSCSCVKILRVRDGDPFACEPRWLRRTSETIAAAWKTNASDVLKPYVRLKLRKISAVSRTACKSGGVSLWFDVGKEFGVTMEDGTACNPGTEERRVMRAQ